MIGIIIISAFVLLGLIISKEFRYGVITTIGSAIVFTPVIAFGIIYNTLYSFYMPFKEKDWKLFFRIWWRAIDGTYSFLGDILYKGFAEPYDELANVWGEWLEDSVGTEEDTPFGEKQTTISATIGWYEYNKTRMFKRGHQLSRVLNIAFRQKRHAIGSWERKLALKELEDRNLHGNIKK
jgi:hypothetical protein